MYVERMIIYFKKLIKYVYIICGQDADFWMSKRAVHVAGRQDFGYIPCFVFRKSS